MDSIKTELNVCSDLTELNTYEKTKKWLEEHVHKNYFPRNPEFQTLCGLIDRHPSKSEWVNQEPTSFKISRSAGTGSLVLYVRFSGLSNYRIVSWVACSKGKLANNSDENKLNGAMRYAIRKQISNYRNSHPIQICSICQTTQKIEVDHHPKHFQELRDNFVNMKAEKNEGPPAEFKWHPKKGNFMFKNGTKANDYYDKKWKQGWQRYHLQHAEYRYLCSLCNKKNNQIVSQSNQPLVKIPESNNKEYVYLKLPSLK